MSCCGSSGIACRVVSRLLFALCLCLILSAYYYPWIAGGRSFYNGDITYSIEPLCRQMGEAFAGGRIPLWNPYLACGYPQIAEVAPGIFYPFHLLFGWMSFSRALALILLSQQLIAGIGAFLLIEGLGWGVLAAATGGLICALNGFMFAVPHIHPLGATAAWLPLLAWLVWRLRTDESIGSPVRLVMCSIITALFILGGRPEIYGPSLLCIFIYAARPAIGLIFNAVTNWDNVHESLNYKEAYRSILMLMALVAGVLLSSPAVFPAAEWAKLSIRSDALNPMHALMWSANWYDWLCLILPQPLAGGDLSRVGADMASYSPFITSTMVGSAGVLLAIIGALATWWRRRWAALCLLAVAAVMAIGRHTIIVPLLLKSFAMIGMLRFQIKTIILPIFLIALLAAAGVKTLLDKELRKPQIIAIWGFLLALLFPTAAQYCGWVWLPVHDLAERHLSPPLLWLAQAYISRASLTAFAVVAALVGGSILFHSHKLSRLMFSAVVIGTVAAPLIIHAFVDTRNFGDADFFKRSSYACDQLHGLSKGLPDNELRIAQLYDYAAGPPPWYHAPGHGVTLQDIHQYGRQILTLNTNEDFHVPSVFAFEARVKGHYEILYELARAMSSPVAGRNSSDVPLHRLCQVTSTRFVLCQMYTSAGKPIPGLNRSLFTVAQESAPLNLRIWRVNDCLPRAYFRSRWRSIDPRFSAMKEIVDLKSQFDPWRTTFVEDGKKPVAGVQPQGEKPETAESIQPLQVDEPVPEHLILMGSFAEDGIVVIADQFYPGWVALVDSAPAKILRVNGFQRGVPVSKGQHTIEFLYRPASLTAGYGAAGFGIALLLLLVFLTTRARPREQSDSK